MTTYDADKNRQFRVLRTGLKAPSSNWSDIECPFCQTVVRAYWWSLAGSGKKCPKCKAIHGSYGTMPVKIDS